MRTNRSLFPRWMLLPHGGGVPTCGRWLAAVLAVLVALTALPAHALPFQENFNSLIVNTPLNGQGGWVTWLNFSGTVQGGPGINNTMTAYGTPGFGAVGAKHPLSPAFQYTSCDTKVVWKVWGFVPSSYVGIGASAWTGISGSSGFVEFGSHTYYPNNYPNPPKSLRTSIRAPFNSPMVLFGDTLNFDTWYEFKLEVDFSLSGGSATLSYREVTALLPTNPFIVDSTIQSVSLGLTPVGGFYTFSDVTTRNEVQGYVDNLHFDDPKPCGCTPPPSGMVAWWPLDETSGTTVTDILGGLNGTTLPGPIGPIGPPANGPAPGSLAPLPQPAVVGGSLYFYSQANRFVQVPNTSSLNFGTGDFTIDAWVYPIQVPQNSYQPIVDKLDVGAKTGYSLYIKSPGIANNARLEFVWGNGTVVLTVQSISPIAYNQWHHVAVTFKRLQQVNPGDPSFEIKMYVNGAAAGAQSGAPSGGVGTIANTLALLIGGTRANTGTGQVFPLGEIALDEVELFNRALAQSEIQAIYNAGSAGKCKGIPVPTGPNIFSSSFLGCSSPPPVPTAPVLNNTPANAQPLAVANQTPTNIDVEVAFNAFLGPVDIYVAVEFPPSTGYPPTGGSPIWFASGPNVWGTTPVPLRTPPSAAAVNMTAAAGSPIYNGTPPAPGSGTFTAYVTVVPPGTPVNPVTFNFTTSPHYTWCYFKTF